jgi:hypothetical protein
MCKHHKYLYNKKSGLSPASTTLSIYSFLVPAAPLRKKKQRFWDSLAQCKHVTLRFHCITTLGDLNLWFQLPDFCGQYLCKQK